MSALSRRGMRVGIMVSMIIAAVPAVGCVPSAHFEMALDQAERARAETRAKEVELAAQRERDSTLAQELRGLEARLREVAAMQAHTRQMQDLVAQNAELSLRVQRAEVAVANIAKTRESEEPAARAPKASIEDMDVRRVSLDRSGEAVRELLRAVQGLVDSGQVKVTVRDGRVRFHLPRNIDEADPYNVPGPSAKTRGGLHVAPTFAWPEP